MIKARGPSAPGGDPAPAEPSVRWLDLLDGRLHRLKRGADFAGPAEAVVGQARTFARQLGKTVATYHDRLGRHEYLWVQFLDGSLAPGQPCPECGGDALEKVQEFFVHCRSCDSLHELAGARLNGARTDAVAGFVDLRVLDQAGGETDEVSRREAFAVEATCRFSRPVIAAHPGLTFFSAGKRVLRSGSPDAIAVTRPQTVTARLAIQPGLLACGSYVVVPSLDFVTQPGQPVLRARPSHAALCRVVSPGADSGDGSPLRWTLTAAATGEPLPVAGREIMARAQTEAEVDADEAVEARDA